MAFQKLSKTATADKFVLHGTVRESAPEPNTFGYYMNQIVIDEFPKVWKRIGFGKSLPVGTKVDLLLRSYRGSLGFKIVQVHENEDA